MINIILEYGQIRTAAQVSGKIYFIIILTVKLRFLLFSNLFSNILYYYNL